MGRYSGVTAQAPFPAHLCRPELMLPDAMPGDVLAARLALIARVLIAEPPVTRQHVRIAILERAILAVPIHCIFAQTDDCAPRGLISLPGALIEGHDGDDNSQRA